MKILFTVCGRAGSKGFKNKNLKTMNGAAIVYYTLAVIYLFSSKHPNYLIDTAVNTDSNELKEIIKSQRILKEIKYVNRKLELAGDTVPKVDVIKDTYLEMKGTSDYDLIIDLDITSPLRKVSDIENAIDEFNSNSNYDLVFSVVEARRNPYFNMVERNEDYYRKICSSDFTARQQAPDVYEMNASIYVYSPRFLKSVIDSPISEYRCGISIMRDYLVLDIDSEEDFHMMEFLHQYYTENDEGLKSVYQLAIRMCGSQLS